MISQENINALRRLVEAREKRDADKRQAERSEEEFRATESEVYEALEDSGVVGTVQVDLGDPYGIVSFRQRETFYGQIVDEDAALEHYERRAQIDEVTKPKFAMRRINEEVRDCLEQGIDLPAGVTFRAVRGVTITRAK